MGSPYADSLREPKAFDNDSSGSKYILVLALMALVATMAAAFLVGYRAIVDEHTLSLYGWSRHRVLVIQHTFTTLKALYSGLSSLNNANSTIAHSV